METKTHNTFKWLFAIRPDERRMALCVVIVLIALHAIVIGAYNNIFTDPSPGYWARFLHHFHLSGYDPITYSVLTTWTAKYNVFRHPLMAFFMAPLYWLNTGLMALTGVNCVQYVVAAVWIVFALYAFLFSYRIQHEIVGIGRMPAILLSAMLFGFAHIMVATIAPDHFILSMTLLLLIIYICGTCMQQGCELSIWATILLFIVTAGITLSNGVKVFICAFFTNGRRFFRLRYLILAVLLPAALLWTTARIEYRNLVLPVEKAEHAKKAADKKRKQEAAARRKAEAERTLKLQVANATKTGDTAQVAKLTARLDSVKNARPKARRNPYGKPIAQTGFMRWTDITTSRTDAIIENLFGEGLQLHQDYVLGDVLRHRPVVVKYRYAFNYIIEFLIVLLFVLGILVPKPTQNPGQLTKKPALWRFMPMLLACWVFDMLLHLGLGFGLNEVYIMSCHWMFIIPIAIGYLIRAAQAATHHRWISTSLIVLVALLTLWLWAWNLTLIVDFFV